VASSAPSGRERNATGTTPPKAASVVSRAPTARTTVPTVRTEAPTFIEVLADLEPHTIAQTASTNSSHGLADGLYAVSCADGVPSELLDAVRDVNAELENISCVRAFSQVTSFLTMYLTIEGAEESNPSAAYRSTRLVHKECKVLTAALNTAPHGWQVDASDCAHGACARCASHRLAKLCWLGQVLRLYTKKEEGIVFGLSRISLNGTFLEDEATRLKLHRRNRYQVTTLISAGVVAVNTCAAACTGLSSLLPAGRILRRKPSCLRRCWRCRTSHRVDRGFVAA
jgi:hypothetical protein